MNFTETKSKIFSGSLVGTEVSSILANVGKVLGEQEIEAYIVGGLVRDLILKRDTADIDIAVSADALEIAPKVATALGGKYVLLDKTNRVGRVVLVNQESTLSGRPWALDFSTFEGSINQDLAQRDFTIDAMAINLGQLIRGFPDVPLIDPSNGWGDIQRGVIKVVAETAFESDAVRLLRAVRLAAELGFNIDKETEVLMCRYSGLINTVAGERIREELLRLLAVSGAGRFLTYLDDQGLLVAMFPELALTKGVKQPKEHFWDVFDHSLKTVTTVEFLLRQGAWEYANEDIIDVIPWSEVLAQHFEQVVSSGSTRGSLLKLAALFHDIAKPQTKAVDANGKTRFLGHAKDGANVVVSMLERLRFSSKEIKLVETEVNHHLRPGQMSQNELPTRRAIYRYFRDTGDAGIDILFLSLADHLATRGPHLKQANWREHARLIDYVLSHHFQEESIVQPPRLIDGHDIINIFNIKPGPRIGEILEAVREAQASGELTTRQEALSFIDKMVSSPICSKGEKGKNYII